MAGHHIELAGLLVAVVKVHRIVQRQVVAGDAAPHHGRVGSEHSSHRQLLVLKVKESGAGLPLVELRHDLVRGAQIEVPEALYDLSGSVTEQEVLLVVPVSGDGIDLEAFPVLGQDVVLACQELLVVHQNRDRIPRNVPFTDPHSDALRGGLSFP